MLHHGGHAHAAPAPHPPRTVTAHGRTQTIHSGTARSGAAGAPAGMGPDAKSARPALGAGPKDPRTAHRKDVLARPADVHDPLE